jgi:hypothetical protein
MLYIFDIISIVQKTLLFKCASPSQLSALKKNVKQISDVLPEQNHKGNLHVLQLVLCSRSQSNIR